MSDEKVKKAPPPPWAWPFAVLCFLIPVFSFGGAIPTALGLGGGFYCLAVAREMKKSTQMRLVHCVAATSVVWLLFAGLAMGVEAIRIQFPNLFQSRHTPPTTEAQSAGLSGSGAASRTSIEKKDPLTSVESRREIYAKAVSMRDDIERA